MTGGEFLATAQAIAQALPPYSRVINLCHDRYFFALAFCAALIRGQTSLHPPDRQPNTLATIADDPSETYCLTDQLADQLPSQLPSQLTDQLSSQLSTQGMPGCASLTTVDIRQLIPEQSPFTTSIPAIPATQLAVIAYTSGSTGVPTANPKYWGTLAGTAERLARRFSIQPGTSLVATVPSQHMYGLEMSVLMMLQAGAALYAGQPFFPRDAIDALSSVPEPRVLVTTPVHLRTLLGCGLPMPALAGIVSATAPLSGEQAALAETQWNVPVMEIYGCTEAGSLATRRTVSDRFWTVLDGMAVFKGKVEGKGKGKVEGKVEGKGKEKDGFWVKGPHLPASCPLQDRLAIHDPQHFELQGRSADMVNLAGKRASLSDLTHKLSSLPGVNDAVVFLPEENGRPAALVVTERSVADLLNDYSQLIDPVFLPRPLIRVEKLPRNETGKLPRQALLACLPSFLPSIFPGQGK